MSIHGMKLMASRDALTLNDLKRYDPRNERPEIAQLKQLANQRKGNDGKFLPSIYLDDMKTWWTYGSWETWQNKPVQLKRIWECLEAEHVPSLAHQGSTVLYWGIERDVVLRDQLVSISEFMIDDFLKSQNEYTHVKRALTQRPTRLQFGLVDYRIDNDVVVINEVQSNWESLKHHRHGRLCLTAIALTEFVRTMANEGHRLFRCASYSQRRTWTGQWPTSVYCDMIPWLGFSRDKDWLTLDLKG